MIWTYRLLPELPPPPAHLIAAINRDYRPANEKFHPRDELYLGIENASDWKKQNYNWIQPMASNKNKRYRFDEDFSRWVREAITAEFHAENSGVMFFDEPQLPHTDLTRDFVLLYNLESGGPKARLCFWQEEGRPVRRDRMEIAERGPHLRLIDSVPGPCGAWYLMNTRVLHSVEGVSALRLNLQISFDTQLPEKFLKYLLTKEIA